MARANNKERIEAVAAHCDEVEETLNAMLRQAEEARGAVDQAREAVNAVVKETQAKVEVAVSEARARLNQVTEEALVSKLGAAYNAARQRNQKVALWWYAGGIVALVLSVAGATAALMTSSTASADLWFVVITRLGISAPTAAFAFYAFSVASKHRTKALQDEQYASELTTLLALFDSLDHQQAQVQLGSLKETLLKNYFPGAEREMQLSKRPEGFQVTGKFLATAAGAAIAVILTLSALLAVILAR